MTDPTNVIIDYCDSQCRPNDYRTDPFYLNLVADFSETRTLLEALEMRKPSTDFHEYIVQTEELASAFGHLSNILDKMVVVMKDQIIKS